MIYRTGLRLLALKALANNFTGDYPTLAENRVYDSRLDSFDVLSSCTEDPLPRIGIYTADHSFEQGGITNPNKISFNQDVTLMLEISVFGFKQATYRGTELIESASLVDDVNDQYIGLKLDILEQQIFDALFRGHNEHTVNFKDYISGIVDISSVDDMSTEGQHKVSMRTLEIKVRLKNTLCNVDYDPQTTNWIDLYPEIRDLIDCPAMAAAVGSITVNNSQNDLNSIHLELNSSAGDYPDTVTKVKVDLNE